jgi:hypothetical protein
MADGRVRRGEAGDPAPGGLFARALVVPVGAEQGWETAVFDHFRAVATAIAAKVRSGRAQSQSDDRTGGATLSFELEPGHPHAERAFGLLARTRQEANALWEEVQDYNRAHPIDRDRKIKVWFYFGQSVEDAGAPAHGADEGMNGT